MVAEFPEDSTLSSTAWSGNLQGSNELVLLFPDEQHRTGRHRSYR